MRALQALMDEMDFGVLTILETLAVQDDRRDKVWYQALFGIATSHDELLIVDAVVDASAGRRCNDLCRRSFSANHGATLWASICHSPTVLRKIGLRRLPRLQSALNGWRRRTPSRSRCMMPSVPLSTLCVDLRCPVSRGSASGQLLPQTLISND